MSKQKLTPIDEVRKFVADLIDKYDEAQRGIIGETATSSKQLTNWKGQLTKLRKRAADALQALEQPAIPGLEERPSYEVYSLWIVWAGKDYFEKYEFTSSQESVGFNRALNEAITGGARYHLFYSQADAEQYLADLKAKAVTPEGPHPLPTRPSEPVPEGPIELVIQVPVPNRKNVRTKQADKLKTIIGKTPVRVDTETVPHNDKPVLCDFFVFVFEPTEIVRLSATIGVLSGPDCNFIVGHRTHPHEPAPVGPAREKIELQVEVSTTDSAVLNEQVADLEAALDLKSAEVVTDAHGATIFFEYDTICSAAVNKLVVEELAFPFVANVLVGDPNEGRFSELELEEIDNAPRKLVRYARPKPTPEAPGVSVTYCTRCVALDHHGADEITDNSAKPDAECCFCGWRPDQNVEAPPQTQRGTPIGP